jgi:hypothetical protein
LRPAQKITPRMEFISPASLPLPTASPKQVLQPPAPPPKPVLEKVHVPKPVEALQHLGPPPLQYSEPATMKAMQIPVLGVPAPLPLHPELGDWYPTDLDIIINGIEQCYSYLYCQGCIHTGGRQTV